MRTGPGLGLSAGGRLKARRKTANGQPPPLMNERTKFIPNFNENPVTQYCAIGLAVLSTKKKLY